MTLELPLKLEETHNLGRQFNKSLEYIHSFHMTIDPWDTILENNEFDYSRACAFAKTLSTGQYSASCLDDDESNPLVSKNNYFTWIATETRRKYHILNDEQQPRWIDLLKKRDWVPTNKGKVVSPKNVLLLLDRDPKDEDDPYVDLDEAVLKGLDRLAKAVNIEFGQAVQKSGSLEKLISAAKRPGTIDTSLITLWNDVLSDKNIDFNLLRECTHDLDLIPVEQPRCDGKNRISLKRLIMGPMDTNPSSSKEDFGEFLATVADTLLADWADLLQKIFQIPENPTADQAVDYLEWVWAQQRAVEVQKAVVSAWCIIVAESSVWPRIQECRERELMKLFCRQPGVYHGKWLPLPSTNPEPVWNDAPDKAACLRDNDGIWLEAWISKKKDINIDDLIKLLGISRLSNDQRFILNVDISGDKRIMSEETQRLGLITQAIHAHRQDEEEDELFTTELTLYSVQSIKRTFSIDNVKRSKDDLDATWDGGKSMYVVGDRSAVWATDLRPLVQQALGLGGNARGLRLLDLLPLLDNSETFYRKFNQLCRELGVPELKEREPIKFIPPEKINPPPIESPSLLPVPPVNATKPNTKVEDPNKTVEPTTPEEIINSRQVEFPPPLPPVPPPNLKKPEGKGEDVERIDKRRGFDMIKTKFVDPAISRFMGRVKQAPNRFLIDGPRSEEEEEEKLACESKLPKDDTDARQKVFEYEQGEGRTPTIATRNQAGYDVSSVDDSSGHERKIEVKGLQGTWENDATVTMTGRQFDDACNKEGDWWLYVVDNLGTDHPRVIPIRNPARGACRFYLYARHWRNRAEIKPPEPLPDDGDE